MSEPDSPVEFLEEITGIPKEQLIEAARKDFERMLSEGQIKLMITPFGRFLVLDHPLLKGAKDVKI